MYNYLDNVSIYSFRDNVIKFRSNPGDMSDGYMTFALERYESREEMMRDVTRFIDVLLKNDFTMSIRHEDNAIIIVEYSHDENIEYYGGPHLIWATAEEVDLIMNSRNDFIEESIHTYEENK